MRNLLFLATLVVLMVVPFARGSGLFVDMDRLDIKKNYLIDATVDQNNDLQFVIQFLNKKPGVRLEFTPFLDGETWSSAPDLINNTKFHDINKTFTFHYSKAIQASRSNSPCFRIENTKDGLCHFRLILTHETPMQWDSMISTPLYVRVHNSTAGSKAAVSLYGGSSRYGGDVSQQDAYWTKQQAQSLSPTLTSRDHSDPIKTLRFGAGSDKHDILSALTPKFYYFDCLKFKKLVEVYDNQTLITEGRSVNLASLGIPYDSRYACSITLITIAGHGSNLVPIRVPELMKIAENPKEWPIITCSDGGALAERVKHLEQELKKSQEELHKSQAKLRETHGRLEGMRGDIYKIGETFKEIQGFIGHRSLASKSFRYLMSKTVRRA